jgi:hypothetical protein
LKDNTNSEGKVNYKEAINHQDFPAFEEAVCELQGVDYETMPYNLKLAFSINLYNMMIKYAFLKIGVGTTSGGRSAFFNHVAFQLGGGSADSRKQYILTFQDLENGILRSNRKAPYSIVRQFGPKDERIRLIMPKVDNRIHFGLNCGASSCPPVKSFTADGIEEELQIVARAFCEDDSNVRIEANVLYLSKILFWYLEDFGGSATESAKAVLGFLGESKKASRLRKLIASGSMQVKYNHYDWSTDASSFASFTADAIKADTSRLVGGLGKMNCLQIII